MGECEYCKEDDCKICKNKGNYVYCIDADPFPDCPYFERMRFCPECGRKLGEEEVPHEKEDSVVLNGHPLAVAEQNLAEHPAEVEGL